MNIRHVVLTIILVLSAAAAGLGWFRFVAHPKPVVCDYCQRRLHSNIEVTVEIGGKRAEACCPRCAMTEANQQHKPLRLITVHDYSTGKAMPPQEAWYVEGSRVMACEHDLMHMDDMKETQKMAFDRCSPGTMAFATRQEAEDFAASNGGSVISFSQLMSEAHYR